MLLGRRAFVAVVAFVSPLARALQAFQPRPISLDEFIALSSRLTGHTDLNRQAADVFLKGLLATPGMPRGWRSRMRRSSARSSPRGTPARTTCAANGSSPPIPAR